MSCVTAMKTTASDFVLRARQLELQAMRHMATRAVLVAVVGRLVHALQWERGLTSLHMASGGTDFVAERAQAIAASITAEEPLRQAFADQLQPEQGATATMLSMMGWVRLDLDSLPALRAAVAQNAARADDVLAAFSRVIAGLIELVFHLADDAGDPATSRHLVALVHLLQAKEAAGQERAVGGRMLAGGLCIEAEQQRFIHLIEAQERACEVLLEFIDTDMADTWRQIQDSSGVAQLERLRRTLCMARPGARLDEAQSRVWFDLSSQRIGEMGGMEAAMIERLQAHCQACIALAQQDLADSTGLVQRLRDNPPPHAQAVDRYYSEQGQGAAVPVLPARPDSAAAPAEAQQAQAAQAASSLASLQQLLERQSARLLQTEQELQKARRTLNERKVIERAKGALMKRLGLSEDAAYRALQKAAMDHNKRLLDVAEATLALSDMALGQAERP